MNKLEVKAFTIMEVTIAMLISAIVIGITYTMYSIVSQSYSGFHQKNESLAVVLRLDEWLRKDFDRAQVISKDTDGIALSYSTGGTIKYKFDPKYMVRISTVTDTFKIKTDSISLSFVNPDERSMDPIAGEAKVDGMDLPVFVQGERITYHYNKIYSSTDLFNHNSNAFN